MFLTVDAMAAGFEGQGCGLEWPDVSDQCRIVCQNVTLATGSSFRADHGLIVRCVPPGQMAEVGLDL